jgi:hypothetical protein
MMFATAGLLVLNLGVLAQVLAQVPQPEGDVTRKNRHLTKASTSTNLTCPGKY